MHRVIQDFISRQHMIANDFELFHYFDSQSSSVQYHGHDFYEVFILYSGSVSYLIEGKQYKMRPGDILLINDKDLHRPIVQEGQKYERMVLWINRDFLNSKSIGESDLSACFESCASKKHNLVRPNVNQGTIIKNILSNMERSQNGSDFGDSILREVYFLELVVLINRLFIYTKDDEFDMDVICNDNINNVVNYINENLDSDLSVDMLSEKFFMSKYHLIREFKKNIGYTVHQYVLLKRLIMSRGLLKEGMPVTEVYSKCGFNDYANFIRCFKNAFGVPPKKYSNQISND